MNTLKSISGKRPLSSLVVVVSAAALLAAATAEAQYTARPLVKRSDSPDIILYNGKISSLDAKDSVYQAIAIRDGKVMAVGENAAIKALARADTETVDLNGRRVLPGLMDGHLH